MKKNLPKKAVGFIDFYEIPGFSRYALSKEGVVINRLTKKILKGSKNPAGYYNYRLTDDDGYTLTWGRHRLLSFVFLNPGKRIDNLVINHKNGIKGYDKIENLEWVTYKQNLEHAGSIGLTSKCCPISVRDIDTGRVKKYPSIVECARDLGVSKDFVNYRIKAGEYRIFPERKQYRASHDDYPWYISEDIEKDLMLNGKSKSILMRNVFTDEIRFFPKLILLAKFLNISPSTITLWMSLPNQPVLPGYIQLKWAHDSSPWRKVADPYSELNKNRITKTIQKTNTKTGEKKIYSSASSCAKDSGLKPTTLNYRLKSNGKKIFSDGCRYSYYS